MDYPTGKKYMISLANANLNATIKSLSFYPLSTFQTLEIKYPGKKQAIGDYVADLNGSSPDHYAVATYLNMVAQNNSNNHQDILDFLLDIYNNGENASHNYSINISNISINQIIMNLEELKYLIYWVTMQEDINYPLSNQLGIKLPFRCYIEAVISCNYPNEITMQDVYNRVNFHKLGLLKPKPWKFTNKVSSIYLNAYSKI